MASVSFYSVDVVVPIKYRKKIRQLVIDVFARERTPFEKVSFIFCSDEYVLQINKQYLKHNSYTDVITFDLSEPFQSVCGEIYMSTGIIKENAKAYGQAYQTELLRVMIHGALHLCGYKDQTTNDKAEMRSKEEFYLRIFRKRFT